MTTLIERPLYRGVLSKGWTFRTSPGRRMRGILGAALIGLALGTGPAAALDTRCSATLRDYGAVGDGVHDDTSSLDAALKGGCVLDGQRLRYRITRSLRLRDGTTLRALWLVQAIPAGDLVRPLYGHDIRNITLEDVHIDRGSDPYNGSGDAAGIWLANVTNLTMTDVEVTGDGPGTGILVVGSRNVVMTRPYVHDMRWAVRDAQPCNEVLEGIRLGNSTGVTLDAPHVGNLLPEAVVVNEAGVEGCARLQPPQVRRVGSRNNMTDGIDPTGNQDVTIRNPEVWKTGEGFDISGSNGARDLLIIGGNVHDIDSACYKITARQGPNIVIRDSQALRCGLWGYVAVGPVTGLSYVNDAAIDIGSSGAWTTNRSGFWLSSAKSADGPKAPDKITYIGNRVTSTQVRPSMDYGFYFRPDPAGSDQRITFEDNSANGYLLGAAVCDLGGGRRAPAWCALTKR